MSSRLSRGSHPALRQRERLGRRRRQGRSGGGDAAPTLPAESRTDPADPAAPPDAGELVGPELERRLSGTGTVVLHSPQFLGGGGIDHIVIGRGGITVVDAQSWSGEVTVRGTVPYSDGHSRGSEVDRLERQRDGVRLALCHASPALRGTGVQAVICLAREPERGRVPLRSGGLWLGGCGAAVEVASRDGVLTAADIEQLRETLLTELPRVQRAQVEGMTAVIAGPGPGTPATAIQTRRTAGSAGRPPAARTPAAHASRDAEFESPAMAAARGRAYKVIASYVLGVVAVAAIGAALLLHSSGSVPLLPTAGVHGLDVGVHGGRATVHFSAPANDAVRFRLTGAGQPREVRLTSDGARQTWHGPRVPAHAALTVEACVVDSAGHCERRAARASFARPHR